MAPLALQKRSSHPRPRPRFDLLVRIAPDEAHAKIQTAIESSGQVRGVALDLERFEVIRDDPRWRIWAPQLDVKLVAVEAGTKVMGRFSPHPNVWMAYLSVYMTSGFAAIACLTYGAVQWSLDREPWALHLTPVVFVIAGLAYGASYVGQGLATGQMYELREFLEDAISSPGDEESIAPVPTGMRHNGRS